jgi:drug/metabolite transporter (DMT)-like permease
MKGKAPSPILVLGALITVQFLFGVNYVFAKIIVEAFPPLVWASIRIVIATLMMVSIAVLSGHKHPKPDRHFFLPLILFAALGMIINQSTFLLGLRYTSATNSAILCTLIPCVYPRPGHPQAPRAHDLDAACGLYLGFFGRLGDSTD